MTRLLRTVTASIIAATWLLFATQSPAAAECRIEKVRRIINNVIVVVDQLVCEPSGTHPVSDDGDAPGSLPPAGSALCIAGMIHLGLDPTEYCFGDEPDNALPAMTDGLVARALRRTELPASELMIQPPGGRTLVNFETNFWTTNDHPLMRTVRLLGRRIELRIWPDSYTWHFGDGEVKTTSTPGARYPDLEVTHNYLQTGDYQPSVETTYVAEWRVAGGQWEPVAGTAVIAGEPADLTAIEARPTLVGYGG